MLNPQISFIMLLDEFLTLTMNRKTRFLITAGQVLRFKLAHSGLVCSLLETPTNIFCKSFKNPNHTCHQCGGCGKICNSRDDLGQHNNTIHPLMCYRCIQFFKDKESKAKHWREIHLMNLKPTCANQGSQK